MLNMDKKSTQQEVWEKLSKLIDGIENLKVQFAESEEKFRKRSAESEEKFRKKSAEGEEKFRQIIADNNLESKQKFDELRQIMADNDFKTNQKLDKLKEIVGGMGNNQGEIAEDLFFNSFSKTMTIGDIQFHSIDRNIRRLYKNIQDEFDLVLTNNDLIMIVEVKVKCHPNDVKKILKKISNYKRLYPMYESYKIYGAIAGLTFPQKTIDIAKENHIYVITQEGNDLKVLNDPQKINI